MPNHLINQTADINPQDSIITFNKNLRKKSPSFSEGRMLINFNNWYYKNENKLIGDSNNMPFTVLPSKCSSC
jgi:hypothetical protein